MATMESLILGFRAVEWLSQVRRNIRQNAQEYKAQAALPGANFAAIGAVMTADAQELLKTIHGIEDIASVPTRRTKLVEFLTVFGITLQQENAVLTELENAAEALRDATKTTKAQIDAASDAVLAAVANYDLPSRAAS
jgi:hypothetical protein